jgi:HPt (histidine-containing phosphotransfer) domain-containing protein
MGGAQGSSQLDLAGALARFGGDESLLHDMMEYFREDIPGLLTDLENGLAEDDTSRARRAAHSIKGLAAHIGANQLAEAAQKLEQLAAANDLPQVRAEREAFQQHVGLVMNELAQIAARR